MTPLFPRWSNTVLWLALGAGFATVLGIPAFLMIWVRSPFVTGQEQSVIQPVKFDHRHHVRDDGIDCLYCHSGAARSANAGVPSTALCMNCHSQIWTQSPELSRVRESYFRGVSIAWQRVYSLPDFTFFNHAIHVNKGVGCVTCHGRVDLMPQVYQVPSLTMAWCLGCHRDPTAHLRPLDKITDMEWKPDIPQAELGRALQAQLGVRSLTDCTACHR